MKLRLFFLAIMVNNYCCGMELEVKPQETSPCIIILNGTTTSGKSSIAAELEKKMGLGKQYSSLKKLVLDDFFHLPLSFLAGITPAEMNEVRVKSHTALCLAAKTAYDQKLDVIIDTVVYKPEDVKLYKEQLKDCLVKWVLVYCPIDKLVERIIVRNENGGITEQRSILQALDQFSHFYQKETSNTRTIDTLSPHTLATVCTLAPSIHQTMQKRNLWCVNNIQNAICPSSFSEVRDLLVKKLAPNGENGEIGIGVVEPHDLIVRTHRKSDSGYAQGIIDFFKISCYHDQK